MQNLVEKIEVIEFNNRDYWIQPIQKYPAVWGGAPVAQNV